MSESEVKGLLQQIKTIVSNNAKDAKLLRASIDALVEVMSAMRDELIYARNQREGIR